MRIAALCGACVFLASACFTSVNPRDLDGSQADDGGSGAPTLHVGLPLVEVDEPELLEELAADPRVDELRAKMEVRENEKFTRDYYDPAKRYIGNAIQVFFKDGTSTGRVEVEYPIGHRKRRAEGIPVLVKKFENAIAAQLSTEQCETLKALCADQDTLEKASVTDFMALWQV